MNFFGVPFFPHRPPLHTPLPYPSRQPLAPTTAYSMMSKIRFVLSKRQWLGMLVVWFGLVWGLEPLLLQRVYTGSSNHQSQPIGGKLTYPPPLTAIVRNSFFFGWGGGTGGGFWVVFVPWLRMMIRNIPSRCQRMEVEQLIQPITRDFKLEWPKLSSSKCKGYAFVEAGRHPLLHFAKGC